MPETLLVQEVGCPLGGRPGSSPQNRRSHTWYCFSNDVYLVRIKQQVSSVKLDIALKMSSIAITLCAQPVLVAEMHMSAPMPTRHKSNSPGAQRPGEQLLSGLTTIVDSLQNCQGLPGYGYFSSSMWGRGGTLTRKDCLEYQSKLRSKSVSFMRPVSYFGESCVFFFILLSANLRIQKSIYARKYRNGI